MWLQQNLTAIELQNLHSFAKMVDYCSSATFHCLQKCIDIFLAKFRNINDKKASIEKWQFTGNEIESEVAGEGFNLPSQTNLFEPLA